MHVRICKFLKQFFLEKSWAQGNCTIKAWKELLAVIYRLYCNALTDNSEELSFITLPLPATSWITTCQAAAKLLGNAIHYRLDQKSEVLNVLASTVSGSLSIMDHLSFNCHKLSTVMDHGCSQRWYCDPSTMDDLHMAKNLDQLGKTFGTCLA